MNKKICLLSLLILPLVSGCHSEEIKGDFYIANSENKIIELGLSELSAKIDSQKDTFFLATHNGDSCTCWTGFQYVIEQYNEIRKENSENYLPFYSFDTELLENENSFPKIDKILSGYVDFYLVIDGEVQVKYSKSAKKDIEIFENVSKFKKTIEKHIGIEPLEKYAYVQYEYVRDNLINKNNSFVLLTVRSGCGDCNYCMPKVVTPLLSSFQYGINNPVYVCDIEKYRGTDQYDIVKENLGLTNKNILGYGDGVVPTYQYWKNGQLEDAGVYANDSFELDEETNKIKVKETYFDGTRPLKFTEENLKEKMNSEESLEVIKINSTNSYYMSIEKAAVYHNPLITLFLSYYCRVEIPC